MPQLGINAPGFSLTYARHGLAVSSGNEIRLPAPLTAMPTLPKRFSNPVGSMPIFWAKGGRCIALIMECAIALAFLLRPHFK
jgi:hypothetical protein